MLQSAFNRVFGRAVFSLWQRVFFLGLVVLICTRVRGVEPPPLLFLGDRDYPPVAYLEDGTNKGMDVDLARALAGPMKRSIRIELMDWNLAQEKVLKGEADGLLGLSVSEERRKLYDFATPTFTREFGLAVRSGELSIRSAGDLKGKNVGVTAGGFPRVFFEGKPGIHLVFINNYRDGLDSLAAGKIDAVAADSWVMAYVIERNHIRGVTIVRKPFATAPGAIALKKGNPGLLAEINRAITSLNAEGKISGIQDDWRPQEMLFASRERVQSYVILTVAAFVVILVGTMGSWVITLKRQVRIRRRVESALKESQERYRNLTEAAFEGVFISEDGQILDVNDQGLKMFGYERSDMIGRKVMDVIAPGSRALVAEAIRTGGEMVYGHELLRKDGSTFFGEARSKQVHAGNRMLRMTALRDITERKMAEQALRESEQKFSKAFRTCPDSMSITDFETGRYIDVNEAHERIFGYQRKDIIGRSSLELGILEDAAIRAKIQEELKAHGSIHNFEVETRTSDGRRLTVLHSAELVELGGRVCALRVSHDITERKQAEQLSETQRRVLEMIAAGKSMTETLDALLRIIESQEPDMLCSILLLDPDGVHIRHGAAPSLPPEYIKAVDGASIGPSAGSCGTAAFRREAVFVSNIATDPLWDEYRHLALPYGLRAGWSTPIFDEQRGVLGTFAIYYRHTGLPDKRALQLIEVATHTAAVCIDKHRIETERTEAISREHQARISYTLQLIAAQEAERKRIAVELHDSLGQNLLLIKNLAQMSLRDQEPAQTYERVASINHLATQCIAETRQISRDLHPHQLDHLGLKRALESMLESVAQASEIKLTWKLDDADDVFSAEAAMSIYRIVQESLNNVLKHSHAKNAQIELERDIHEVQLRISDDGCGFAPGRSADNKKGLGLKNIPERVRMLGGKLKINSAPGKGTRIEVTIPIAAEAV